MSGDMLPWFAAFLIALVVGLLAVIVALLPRALRTMAVTGRFYCPWVGRHVVVEYLANRSRRPLDVISCTAFADPNIVTCEKMCVTGGPPPDTAGKGIKATTAASD